VGGVGGDVALKRIVCLISKFVLESGLRANPPYLKDLISIDLAERRYGWLCVEGRAVTREAAARKSRGW
jgi:hypothetical protein